MINANDTKHPQTDKMLCREAVGIFSDEISLEKAIDELLMEGFDRRELSLLSHEDATSRPKDMKPGIDDLADRPSVSRTDYFCPEALGGAEGAVVGTFTYIPAWGAIWVASSVGASTLATAVAGAATGGAGLLVGSALAFWLARRHRKHVEEQIEHGGLLLWVRTRNSGLEQKALETLSRNHATHVHLHGK
jgi:hypothetical protein